MINLRFWERTPEEKNQDKVIDRLNSKANKKYEKAIRKLQVFTEQIEGIEEILVIKKEKHA